MINPEDEKEEKTTPTPESEPEKSEKPVKKKAAEKQEKKEQKSKAKDVKKPKPKEKASKPSEKGKKQTKAKKDAKPSTDKKSDKAPAKDDTKKAPVPRMLLQYKKAIIAELTKRFKYTNVMMVPRLQKIVINVGIGEAATNSKLLDTVMSELALIAGQQPAITRARKSISNFKLRQGMAIGCRVTLRGNHMWEFFDRLLNVAIPRIRDFRGLPDRSFDGRGSYTMGIKEQIIFPEIDMDKIDRVHGLNITFVTSAKTDEEAHALLTEMGMPFRRRATQNKEQAA
ncbi:50S ribosomal protein L5 [candidate division LCP-89 bacterium B3_LCP]|uniref:Large ribosomal subunit protein uL5 n=1 Tax=candidate division LCP-89 bacterium B3_LCP TaxID=2012998 RepID=A0A532UZN0_UNCL8|nr:MAG: 50S ribosomal protein L5 [candidate division LCP-89 bacterium B3_LCP]